MKKILIPIDGSDYSQRAMDTAKELAALMDSRIILLNVMPLYVYPLKKTPKFMKNLDFGYQESEVSKDAQAYLDESKESFGELADKVETVLMDGDPADVILKFIENQSVDLIVIGSHGIGASTLRQMFVGSVTSKILKYSAKPVLVVK